VPFNFSVPRFLQVNPLTKKILYAIPFVGDVLTIRGEYEQNRKAGLSKPEAARRAVGVGGAGVAASALPPADIFTVAPGVTRLSAEQAETPQAQMRRDIHRGLGIAGGGFSPETLRRTADVLDYLNPETLVRSGLDLVDRGRTYSLNPDERLEELKRELLEKAGNIQ
jgi:hypothetical protein